MTHATWKRAALISFALASFAAGWVVVDVPDRELESSASPYNVISSIFTALALFVWYFHDAAERNFQRSRAWDLGIILVTSIVVFPVYLFKTRGTKGGFKSLGLLLLFVGFVLIPAALAGMWIGSKIGA